MARFEVSGIEAAQEAFLRRSERAAKAVPKMLKAGGAVLVKACLLYTSPSPRD
jgi:hypothetical protein